MGKNALKLFGIGLLLWTWLYAGSVAAKITVLKFDRPIPKRPDICITTYVHQEKFRGFHTMVIQKIGKHRTVLFKTINPNKPFIHHEYAVYWAMCEFMPGSDSDDSCDDIDVETFDNASRFDLFAIQEEYEEKE